MNHYTFTGNLAEDAEVARRMLVECGGVMTVSPLAKYGGLTVFNAFRALSYTGAITMTDMGRKQYTVRFVGSC